MVYEVEINTKEEDANNLMKVYCAISSPQHKILVKIQAKWSTNQFLAGRTAAKVSCISYVCQMP